MVLNKINKNLLLISYKLLADLLSIFLFFSFSMLIAEGLIPGIVTDHISFSKVILVIFVNLFAVYYLGNYLKVSIDNKKVTNKKTIIFLIVLGIALIFNSLLKLDLFLNIFILLLSLVSGYLIYKEILD